MTKPTITLSDNAVTEPLELDRNVECKTDGNIDICFNCCCINIHNLTRCVQMYESLDDLARS